MDNKNKQEQEAQQKQEKREEINLENLLKKNLIISQEILDISKYVKKYIFWRKVMNIVKIVIILVPIILGIIYLPPILEEGLDTINENLNNPLSSIINSNCENEQ
ncbi:MAG: hypothetical protein ACLFNO_03235 [Parcubacteria group bacterium]